jgi:hypothetical protein
MTIPSGNFNSLSPGNQKIDNALFSAQKTTGTTTPLTKDQIAGLKGTEGWGKVFKTMKADGLVQSKNLGQVVSGYQHSLHSSTASTARSGTGRSTTGGSTTHASTRTGSRFSSAGMSGRGVSSSRSMGGAGMSAMGGGMGSGGFSHGGGFGGGGGHGR